MSSELTGESERDIWMFLRRFPMLSVGIAANRSSNLVVDIKKFLELEQARQTNGAELNELESQAPR